MTKDLHTAEGLYEAVLVELNSYGSPLFDVADFNYWINKASDQFIKEQLNLLEVTAKETHYLRMISKKGEVSFSGEGSLLVYDGELPVDYRRLTSCQFHYRVTSKWKRYLAGDRIVAPARRLRDDSEDFILSNSYFQPTVKEPYYKVIGQKLYAFFHPVHEAVIGLVLEKAEIRFIAQHEDIELGEDLTDIKNSPFQPEVNRELVKLCTRLFLENSGNPRLQTHLPVNN